MIDIDLRSFLLSQAVVSSKVSDRMYALRLPQASTSTSLVYDVGEGIAEVNAGSVTGVIRYSVALSVYSSSYVDMRVLSTDVVGLLQGYTGSMGTTHVVGTYITNSMPSYEEDTKLYRNIILFNIFTN